MMEIDSYTDQEIVRAILDRDTYITKEFLYKKCYPMFKAIHSRYYTDCETTIDFISEIYIYILSVHPKTGICKLAGFKFMSSLRFRMADLTRCSLPPGRGATSSSKWLTKAEMYPKPES